MLAHLADEQLHRVTDRKEFGRYIVIQQSQSMQHVEGHTHQAWNPAHDLEKTINTKPTDKIFFAVLAV